MCYNSKWYLFKGWLILSEDNKSKTIRLPHMFQKSFRSISRNHDIDFLDANLAKIVKSYQNTSNSSISVTESIKRLLQDEKYQVEKLIDEYLKELNRSYRKKEINETINEEIDIDEILKSSEEEIKKHKDQKSLLKNLIDDININDNTNLRYDDEKFASNIEAMIKETLNED